MLDLYVIVPCFNGGKFVHECLSSIKNFCIKNNDIAVKIIFIDDGSTDDTKLEVSKYMCSDNSMNIKYIYKANAGLSAARNEGLLAVSKICDIKEKSFILFLDVDDFLFCQKFEEFKNFSLITYPLRAVNVDSLFL